MDPFIINSTPKGSALLAYGSARGPGWNIKLLAIVAGSLAFVVLTSVAAWIFFATIQLPANRLLTIAIQPRVISKKINPVLQPDLPSPWRAALQTGSRFPTLLGVTIDHNRRLHAFALVPRTARIAAEPGFSVSTHGAFHLLTDQGIETDRESIRIANAFRGARTLNVADAVFTLRSDLIAMLAGEDASTRTSPEELFGSFSGRTGTLSLVPDHASADGAIAGPMFAVFGDNTNDIRPVASGLLSQGIDLRALSDLPRSIGMDPANGGSIALTWPSAPSNETAGRLLAIQKNGQYLPLALPDTTEIIEIHPGIVASSTQNGSTTLFFGDGLAGASLDLASAQVKNPSCQGNIRFSLQGEPLHRALEAFSIPASWQALLTRILIAEDTKSVRFCLE